MTKAAAKKTPVSCGLILSSGYLSTAQVAEFGRLPPSFLCLANKRLYSWQVRAFPETLDGLYLTLPSDFVMEPFDKKALAEARVHLLSTPASYSVGKAIQEALRQMPADTQDIWILYGDTLLKDFATLPVHALATGYIQEHANWGYCVKRNKEAIAFDENFDTNGANVKPVIAGGFHFSVEILKEALQEADADFMKALGLYGQKTGKLFQTKELTWYDFGHVHSALRSRQTFTTERAFNSMRIEKRRVSKYSKETKKILSEAAWYEGVPRYLDVFLPNYLGRIREEGMFGYATEYLYLNPISDLFVFGRLPEYVWQQILTACKEFLEVCLTHTIPQSEALADIDWLYNEKTVARLHRFSTERGIDLDRPWVFNGQPVPSLNKIFADVLASIPKASNAHLTITHGDFHFANIFFDFRSLCIKAVDPRGLIKDNQTVFGDRRYDLAKLSHSVNGLYDYIIAGILEARVDTDKYEIAFDVKLDAHILKVQRIFNDMLIGGLSPASHEICAMVIILYLSMLPLHADNKERQDTLLANVFRLYIAFIALPLETEDPHVCFPDGGA